MLLYKAGVSEICTGSRKDSRCQYTWNTDSWQCHLSVTAMQVNPIPHVQFAILGQCSFSNERQVWGWDSSTL